MLRSLLCVTLLAAGSAAATGSTCDDPARPLVATREGLVQGMVERSAAGRDFFSFRGIPYGTAPRFEPPQRRAVWPGVHDAAAHGTMCWQFDTFDNMTLKGDEDCLFANVYTPQLPATENAGLSPRLPVMVFIHGGGFTQGNGDDYFYGPSYLLDEDVVLVTFNYRLGIFGLFSTGSEDAPGNYGFLDQVLLLQWVQDNIAAFGGDPNSVTIFGQSAGGSCVSLLVLSPLAKGLFHHAISESGASLSGFIPDRDALPNCERFAKLLNCTGTAAELVGCLKKKTPTAMMEAWQPYMMEDTFFMPRVDSESPAPFIPENPRSLLERGEFNLVPWMNGINEEEGAMYVVALGADPDMVAALAAGNLTAWAKASRLVSLLWDDWLEPGADLDEETTKVRDFYSPVSAENVLPVGRAQADHIFLVGHAEEVRLASQYAPVYQYLLDHRGPGRMSLAEVFGLPPEVAFKYGPTHGDDLVYLFNNRLSALVSLDSPEYAMIRFMTGVWTSFARTGRPSSPNFAMPDWPVFTETSQRHMRLSSESAVAERLFQNRTDLWQTVRVREAWKRSETHSAQDA